MGTISKKKLNRLWAQDGKAWRNPWEAASFLNFRPVVNPKALTYRVEGGWWNVLSKTRGTLLVTREYEHLVMALNASGSRPVISYMQVPHPSGLAIDRKNGVVSVASTRNPNQIIDFRGISKRMDRSDIKQK